MNFSTTIILCCFQFAASTRKLLTCADSNSIEQDFALACPERTEGLRRPLQGSFR